ncbi:hypothetical protein [Acinetobacter baumannii]|uniref:hypothetical protein n=1 Tax=Acinetobacter baumannii TaxID=470 RepID=UPI0035CFFC14
MLSLLIIIWLLKLSHLMFEFAPIAEVSLKLWLSTEGSSQIMIGFFALSIVSAWLMVSFFTALKTSVWQTKQMASKYEQLLFKAYRYVPMVFLSSLVAYLSLQLSIAF